MAPNFIAVKWMKFSFLHKGTQQDQIIFIVMLIWAALKNFLLGEVSFIFSRVQPFLP